MQRVKDIVLGAITATLIIGVAPTVMATVGEFDIPVSYNDIKVYVDGEELVTDKEAFTYKGTTFLPVRAVAEAVGKDVIWDGDTMSIYLNSSEEELAAAAEAEAAAEVEAELEEEAEEDGAQVLKINEEVANQNGLSIKATEAVFDTNFKMGFELENRTTMHYGVQVDKMYINGILMKATFFSEIYPNRTTSDVLSVWASDLADAGIDEIKTVKIYFEVAEKNDDDGGFDMDVVYLKASDY